jgi:hypothetical protein
MGFNVREWGAKAVANFAALALTAVVLCTGGSALGQVAEAQLNPGDLPQGTTPTSEMVEVSTATAGNAATPEKPEDVITEQAIATFATDQMLPSYDVQVVDLAMTEVAAKSVVPEPVQEVGDVDQKSPPIEQNAVSDAAKLGGDIAVGLNTGASNYSLPPPALSAKPVVLANNSQTNSAPTDVVEGVTFRQQAFITQPENVSVTRSPVVTGLETKIEKKVVPVSYTVTQPGVISEVIVGRPGNFNGFPKAIQDLAGKIQQNVKNPDLNTIKRYFENNISPQIQIDVSKVIAEDPSIINKLTQELQSKQTKIIVSTASKTNSITKYEEVDIINTIPVIGELKITNLTTEKDRVNLSWQNSNMVRLGAVGFGPYGSAGERNFAFRSVAAIDNVIYDQRFTGINLPTGELGVAGQLPLGKETTAFWRVGADIVAPFSQKKVTSTIPFSTALSIENVSGSKVFIGIEPGYAINPKLTSGAQNLRQAKTAVNAGFVWKLGTVGSLNDLTLGGSLGEIGESLGAGGGRYIEVNMSAVFGAAASGSSGRTPWAKRQQQQAIQFIQVKMFPENTFAYVGFEPKPLTDKLNTPEKKDDITDMEMYRIYSSLSPVGTASR